MPYKNREKYLEHQRTLYRQNKDRYKRNALRSQYARRYGLTAEAFALLQATQTHCPICGQELVWTGPKFSKPHVDHDHATGKVRGLLCGRCNVGLGSFGDEPARLLRAAEYLAKHG